MLKKLNLALMRMIVKTVGMSSDGIRMSFQHGFISGKMLDYIYANEPAGRFGIGRWIDRMYLSHPGWQAIRQRKVNLCAALEEAIALRLKENERVSVLDVASGPAQYMVDVLSKFRGQPVEAVCRDYDPAWVGEGRDKARVAGLTNLSFMVGDAFDRESFLKFWDREDVVVSSGFYDWITDDSLIKKSMEIIAECLRPGGYFVFTNQSGHVDLEMVQAVFIDFNKQPLRMTTRPAAVLNHWAREAGFEIVRSVADEKNYYTVTLAKKI